MRYTDKRDLVYAIGSLIMEWVPDLQDDLACKRPRRADGIVPVKTAGWNPRKSQCFRLDLKAGKQLIIQRPSQEFSLTLKGGSAFLFSPGLQLMWWGPSTYWGKICVTQCSDLNLTSFKDTQKHPEIMFDHIPGHPTAQSSWRIKLSITPELTTVNIVVDLIFHPFHASPEEWEFMWIRTKIFGYKESAKILSPLCCCHHWEWMSLSAFVCDTTSFCPSWGFYFHILRTHKKLWDIFSPNQFF